MAHNGTYQIANDNLAVSVNGRTRRGGLDCALCGASVLGDASNRGRGSGRSARLALTSSASGATTSTATASTSVGHDLIQRLIELGGHFDGICLVLKGDWRRGSTDRSERR
jgi:hypothetical protein